MQIDQIDTYLVRFPLKKPYTMADKPLTYIDTVLLKMHKDGVSGWGEVFPGNEPTLTAAWSSAVYDCLEHSVLPRLSLHNGIESGGQLIETLQGIRGNRHSKAVVDLAWWDLSSRLKNEPLYKTLGGNKNEIEAGVTFDRYEKPELFLDDIRRAVNEGFKRITLKIRPGWDLQVLGAVRSEFPTVMIQCDVEGSLRLDVHNDTIYRFDDFMPALLEQPLSDSEFVGHAMLQDSLRTPIALDESITNSHQAEIALDLRSCSVFCLKPGRTGGLTEAKTIYELAKREEADCYIGTDITTSIGYRFAAALASLAGTLPTDYIRFDEYFENDPGVQLKPVLQPLPEKKKEEHTEGHTKRVEVHPDKDGKMSPQEVVEYDGPNVLDGESRLVLKLWDEPGIGFEPDEELIKRNILKHCCFKR
ncbi:o-succinylbenzoate synthase [Planctomycetales bacterium]|nr:o-succinylbenzoate synthase [Planctomycetales bacterium]